MRACQMLELLAPEHTVTLLAPRPVAGQPPPPGTTVVAYRAAAGTLRALGGTVRAAVDGLPLQSGWFTSADLRRQLHRLAPRTDLAILQLVRLAAHRDDLGATPVLVDLIDDLALNLARRAAVDRRWLRPALSLEARRLARAQLRLVERAAGTLLVCDRDRRHLTSGQPGWLADRVHTVPLAVEATGGELEPSGGEAGLSGSAPEPAASTLAPIGIVPEPAGAAPAAGDDGPPVLLFSGNLGYFVNEDAIAWWLREVWPAAAARHPGLRLVVAGDRPPPRLRRLAAAAAAVGAASPGGAAVTLVASPPTMAPLFAGAMVALAPMRCGSGVPVKILEAWAHAVPVVASPWAAAGTTAVPGEDLLVASSPAEWLAALSTLLRDPAARQRLAANGRRRLLADASQAVVKARLLAAVGAACGAS